jgi:LemA protein
MTALEGTENRINVSRERYNEAVQDYNTTIRTFPAIIGAKIIYGAKPMVPFTATEAAQTAPSVDLNNIGAAPGAGAAPQAAAPANDNAPAANSSAAAGGR